MVLPYTVVKDHMSNPVIWLSLWLVLLFTGLQWIEKPHKRKTALSIKKKKIQANLRPE